MPVVKGDNVGGGRTAGQHDKGKPKRWGAAFVEQLEAFAHGLGPGLAALGKATYNDVDHAVGDVLPGRHSTSFLLDDVAKAAAKDTWSRYKPLAHGDFKGFYNQVATRPLDFLFDATAMAGGAGAVVSKGGEAAVAAGRGLNATAEATKAARRAGLTHVHDVVNVLEDGTKVTALDAAKRVYGAGSKEVRQAERTGLVRRVRTRGKGELQTMHRGSKNPVHAVRDAKVDELLGHDRLTSVRVVGQKARAARADARPVSIRADVQRSRIVDPAARAVQNLGPKEQAAWWFLHEGHTSPAKYADKLEGSDLEVRDDFDRMVRQTKIDLARDPEVQKLVAEPTRKLAVALRATKKLAREDLGPLVDKITGGNVGEREQHIRALLPKRIMDGARMVDEHPTRMEPRPGALEEVAAGPRETHRAGPQGVEPAGGAALARTVKRSVAGGAAAAVEEARAGLIPGFKLRKTSGGRTSAQVLLDIVEQHGIDSPQAQRWAASGHQLAYRRLRERARELAPAVTEDRAASYVVRDTPTHEQVQELLTAQHRKLIGGRYSRNRGALKRWLGELYNERRYGHQAPSREMRAEDHALETSARARAKRHARVRQVPSVGDMLDLVDKVGPWDRRVVRMIDEAGGARQPLWARLRKERSADLRMLDDRFPAGSLEAKLAGEGYHPTDRLANLPDDYTMDGVVQEWIDEQTGDASLLDLALGHMAEGNEYGAQIDQHDARAMIDEARRLDPELPDNPDDSDVASALASRFQPLAEPGNIPTRKEYVDRAFDAIMRIFEENASEVNADAVFPTIRGRDARLIADRLGIRSAEHGYEPDARDWATALQNVVKQAGFDERYRSAARALRGASDQFDERGTAAFAGAFVPAKLKKAELLNPETGALHSEEDAARSTEELAAMREGIDYHPHRVPPGGRAPSARAYASTKREPGVASNLSHSSTGRAFETGSFSHSPLMLLQEANAAIRTEKVHALYNAAIVRGVKFDRERYLADGGEHEWMVLDQKGVTNLAKRLGRQSALTADIRGALPEGDGSKLLDRIAADTRTMLDEESGVDTSGLRMVPRAYYDRLTGDMASSDHLALKLIDGSLDVFRGLVLFARPAYYVNNAVGNAFMLAVRDGGPMVIPRYIRFLAQKGNHVAARRAFRDAVTTPDAGMALWDELTLNGPLSPLRSASSYDIEVRPGQQRLTQQWGMSGQSHKIVAAKLVRSPDHLNRFAAALTDDLPRQFRAIRLLMPHVNEARAAGMVGDDAQIAAKLLEDDAFADRITEQVLFDLVDYRGMGPSERKVIRRIVPFYGWMRGITLWTAELGYHHPEQMLALAQVSGVGQRDNEEFAAGTPGYLASGIRLGDGTDRAQKVLLTQGLMPLDTIAQLAQIGNATVAEDPGRSLAGSTISGQFNPFMTTLAGAFLNDGKQLGSNIPLDIPGASTIRSPGDPRHERPGRLATAALGWAASTPQAQLVSRWRSAHDAEALYGHGHYGAPTSVYNGDPMNQLLSYLGVPIRTVNLQAAAARRRKDEQTLAGDGGFR